MYKDALCLLSDSQSVTSTAVSTNTYDCGNPSTKNDIGNGEPMEVAFCVGVAADFTTGDETYQFDLITSASANLGTPTVISSRVVAAGLLTAGAIIHSVIPKGAIVQRYFGVRYTTGGTTPTITVSAFLVPVSMAQQITPVYASGFKIS